MIVLPDILAAYLKTTGLGCAGCVQSSYCLIFKIILFFLSLALSSFDCYSDWSVWANIRKRTTNSQLPLQWTQSWLVFSAIGTAITVLYIMNEVSGIVALYRQYKKRESVKKMDLCRPCVLVGCNYITRAEVLALMCVALEDLPLLILTIIFSAFQYKCNHLKPLENLPILKFVYISALASLLTIGWNLLRFLFYLALRLCSHHQMKHRRRPQDKSRCNQSKDLKDASYSKELEARRTCNSAKELESKSSCGGSSWIVSKDTKAKTKSTKNLQCAKEETNQLYPLHQKMKWCLICHSVTALLVYGPTICISATAVALTRHQQSLANNFAADPTQYLGVYRSHPQEELLVNSSTIAEHESGILCLTDEFQVLGYGNNLTISCKITFAYSLNKGHIYFNYAGNFLNASNSTQQLLNVTEQTEVCDDYYSGVFLGHYTTGGVKRFDDTCPSLFTLHESSTTVLQRQRDLPVKC